MEKGRRAHRRGVALCVLAACGGSESSPPASKRVGNAVAAALVAADHADTAWRCAALDVPAFVDEILPQGFKLSGHTVSRTNDGDVTIGVVADAGGASPRTIAALSRLRSKLEAANTELVITLGGMGATQAELEGTLGTLADHAAWPVIALAGDLEPETAQVAAIAALRKRGDVVIDGRLARWIELPGATIATIPGSGAQARLVSATDGCSWRAEDVAKIYTDLTARPGVRITAMSEAPREIVGGDPTGELALVPSPVQPIEVLLHAPAIGRPSQAHTGARGGGVVYLSPGASDATARLPEPSPPSAGILTIRGAAWSWRPIVAEP